MADREKIIKGLECCRIQQNEVPPICEACPYADEARGTCEDMSGLLNDAYEMLKAQEPRVMTLEDLAGAQKTPVWRETKRAHKDLYNGWVLAYDIQRGQGITWMRQGMAEPNGRVGWYKLDDYGKTWRCWTARPTLEQREAAKWDAAT